MKIFLSINIFLLSSFICNVEKYLVINYKNELLKYSYIDICVACQCRQIATDAKITTPNIGLYTLYLHTNQKYDFI